ncbi:MAG: hypothetical protein B7Z52_03260, partial [Burkholderiales bacterium 12-64-5]
MRGGAVERRQLHPHLARGKQVDQFGKARLARPTLRPGPGEMVEDDRRRASGHGVAKPWQQGEVGIDLHRESVVRHAAGRAGKGIERGARAGLALGFQIDAHAPHPRRPQSLQFSVGDGLRIDHRNPAPPSLKPGEGIEQAAVVGAIDAGLHQHHAVHAEAVEMRFKHGQAGAAGCVGAALPEGKKRRLKHMDVAVAGAGGNRQAANVAMHARRIRLPHRLSFHPVASFVAAVVTWRLVLFNQKVPKTEMAPLRRIIGWCWRLQDIQRRGTWTNMDTPLVTQLAAQILDHIQAERMEPGTQLVERKFAEQFRVSRSPVRRALTLLEQSGHVVANPSRGGFSVCALTIDTAPPPRPLAWDEDETAYLKIAEDNLEGRLPDKVTDSKLARDYGLSSAQLRRVLARIANEGWIERLPGHG